MEVLTKCRGWHSPSKALGIASGALVLALLSSLTVRANNYTWSATGTAGWGSSSDWTSSPAGGTYPSSLTDTATFAGTTAATSTLGATQTVGTFVDSDTAAVSILGGGSANTLNLGTGGITMAAGTGALTIGSSTATQAVNISLNGSQSWTNGSSSLLTLTNGITNVAGSSSPVVLTINGGGTGGTTLGGIISDSGTAGGTTALTINTSGGATTLSGTNTFSGGVTLTTGTLNVNNASALGAGTFTIGSTGAVLNSTVSGGIVNSQNNVQQWNAGFTFAGTDALNLGTGAVTMAAPLTLTVTSNTLTVGGTISGTTNGVFDITKAGAGTLVINENVALSANQTETLATTANGGTLSFGGVISGSGYGISLVGNGVNSGSSGSTFGGVLQFTNADTYSGATSVGGQYSSLKLSGSLGSVANSTVTVTGGSNVTFDDSAAGVTGTTRANNVTLAGGYLNINGNTTANSVDTITTSLTTDGNIPTGYYYADNDASGSMGVVSLAPGSGHNVQLSVANLTRANQGVFLFRGTGLGSSPIASPTANTSNIVITGTTPTLVGGGGALGSTTISIIPYALGGLTSSDVGSTFVTYTSANGIVPLAAADYVTNLASVSSAYNNVDLTGTSAATTVTLTSPTTINSLIINGGSGGYTIAGSSPNNVLTVTSGAVFLNGQSGSAGQGAYINSNLAFGSAQGVIGGNFNRAEAINGSISGSGGLVIYTLGSGTISTTGNGAVTLDGNNTYTGDTYVLGNLELYTGSANQALASMSINGRSGNVIDNGFIDGNVGVVLNGLSGDGYYQQLHADSLTVGDNNATSTFAGALSGGNSVTKIGTGTWTLSGASSATSPFTVNGGLLSLTGSLGAASLGVGGGNFGYAPSGTGHTQAFTATSINAGYSAIDASSGNTLTLAAITRNAGGLVDFNDTTAGTITTSSLNTNGILGTWAVTGSGTSLNYAMSGSTGTNPITAYTSATALTSAGATGATTNYKLAGGATTTLSGAFSGNTLQLTGATGTLANGGNAITLNGLMNSGSGSMTLNGTGTISIGANKELDIISNGQNTAISSIIGNSSGGASSLVYGGPGAGTLYLNAANTYTGGTTIDAGTVTVGTGGTLGATTGALAVNGAGTVLNLNTSSATTVGTLSGTGVGLTGAAGTINNGGQLFTVTQGAAGTYNGVIAGLGGLTVAGTKTLTLAGANTYSGATTINSGANLYLGSGGALGTLSTSSAIVDNGVLAINRLTSVAQGTDFSGAAITGSGGFTQAGTGTTTLNAANTYTGNTTISGGVLNVGSAETAGVSGPLGDQAANAVGTIVFAGGTLQFSSANQFDYSGRFGSANSTNFKIDTNGQNVTFASVIASNGGTFTLNDTNVTPGTLTLAAADTFNGATTVTAGTLQVGNGTAGSIALSAATVAATGTLAFDQANNTAYTQTIADSGIVAGTEGTSDTNTLTNVISGTGGFNQTGAGTTVLTGTNTYSGATAINAGRLNINGSTAAGSAFTVASGAALGGSGTVNGGVTINSGGAINMHGTTSGTGTMPVIGTLTVGSLTINNTSSVTLPALTFDITSGSSGNLDQIVDSGALTLGGANGITVNVDNLTGSLTTGTTLTTGTYTLLSLSTATLSNTQAGYFSLSNTSLDGDRLSLTNTSSALELIVAAGNTTGSYTLASTVGSSVLHVGATTTATTTLANTGTGSADSLNYTGLGSTAATGSITGATGSGGPVANTGGTAVATQTYTAETAGTDTVTPTATSVTGANGSGTAVDTGTSTATVTVYSGQGVWKTAGSGTWGSTITAAPANWTAIGGTPGITPGFLTTDSASFGNTGFSGTATVTLGSASPYLNAITFNNSAGTYDIEQGGTGTLHLDSTGTATVTVSAGSHIIGAPVELDSAAATAVASSDTLTINGTISQSGTQSLALTGAGTTILSGANTYSGGTSVTAGTLLVSNTSAGGSATGTGSLTVSGGATIGGYGTSSGTGFSVSGTSSSTANVLVGMNSASDTNTSQVLTLKASGASTIANANLTFNLNATTNVGSNAGTQLAVGSTNITFGSAVKFTLNMQDEPAIVAAYTPYVLIAGTGVTTDTGGVSGGQYSGLSLGAVTTDTRGGTDTLITGSNLQLAFGSTIDTSYYGAHSYLVLYQNSGVDDIEVEVVPEPGTWALMLGGLAMLVFWQRRRRND